MASNDINFGEDQDYVVCGSCGQNFPLSGLPKFVHHKRFDCDPEHSADQPEKLLICQSCPQSFSTPWSLLRHAQNNHAIRLFIECGPYNANFTSLRPGDTSEPNQSEMLAAARRLSQTLMDRNPGELRPPTGPESVIPALALSSTLPVTQEKSRSTWDSVESCSSGHSSPGPVATSNNPGSPAIKPCHCPMTSLPCCRPTAIVTRLNDVGVQVGREVELECDQTICNCSSQDCGVTIVPGTHENMKKCCAEVVPKKRKRHMETKHIPPGLLYRRRKRLSRSNSRSYPPSTDSICIDVSASTAGTTPPQFTVSQGRGRDGIMISPRPVVPPTMNSVTAQVSQAPVYAMAMSISSNNVQQSNNVQSGRNQHMADMMSLRQDRPGPVLKTAYQPQADQMPTVMSSRQTNSNTPNANMTNHSIPIASKNQRLPNEFNNQLTTGPTNSTLPAAPHNQTLPTEVPSQPVQNEPPLPTLYAEDIPVPFLAVSGLENSPDLNLQTIDAEQLSEAINDALMKTNPQVSEESNLEIMTGKPSASASGEDQGYTEEGERNRTKRRRYPTSRPFKCEQCGRGFNQRIHLRKHQSKHTGIKPYKCEQCDYSTVERSHLKVHIRVHTGEKPYKCMYCEYATAQNSTLKIHLKRRHHITGFTCEHCGKGFGQKDLLETHTHEHQVKPVMKNTNAG